MPINIRELWEIIMKMQVLRYSANSAIARFDPPSFKFFQRQAAIAILFDLHRNSCNDVLQVR